MLKIIIVFNLLFIVSSCAKNKIYYSSVQTFSTDSTLDILSWNIETFPKHDSTVDYLVDIIDSINVDIIAMQEISDKTKFINLLDRLDGWSGSIAGDGYGLGYLYKSELSITKISLIDELNDYNLTRTPYMLEIHWDENIIYIINNHFKCCGNNIVENRYNDEEYRRLNSCLLIKNYIDLNLDDQNVIVLGDLNDDLCDPDSSNVFLNIINDKENYLFADHNIACGSSINWSYPRWPSHLDHILITNELFDEFENMSSKIQTLHIENYFDGGWIDYEKYLSDHRPIGLSLKFNK